MAKPVILGALLRVAENRVRLGSFFEFFLGFSVAGVAIRVVLERHLPVGALDFLFRGGS
jgi:hypothetical protein